MQAILKISEGGPVGLKLNLEGFMTSNTLQNFFAFQQTQTYGTFSFLILHIGDIGDIATYKTRSNFVNFEAHVSKIDLYI